MGVPIKSLTSIGSFPPQKSWPQEPVTLINQSSANAPGYSKTDESLSRGESKLQVPMMDRASSLRLRTGLTESLRSDPDAQWLKRAFKCVTRMSRTSLITALKAVLLLQSVRAEEESILDTATVTSPCHSNHCVNNQMVIGPGFKSRWYDTSNPNGDQSNEI